MTGIGETAGSPSHSIFICIDEKAAVFDPDQLVLSYSSLHIIRKRISWGSYSLVDATLSLLRESTNNGPFRYYHLLSGQDLPLKTKEYIHNFFKDKDLIHVTSYARKISHTRLDYIFPLREKIGRGSSFSEKIYRG
ncbi:MAG: hypothetical protein J5494_08490 [Candidatus Methanomethylophilaceae archaeon]|nr:hypothetical protein [Candidatus Methanomethylophilaceae archaeon]